MSDLLPIRFQSLACVDGIIFDTSTGEVVHSSLVQSVYDDKHHYPSELSKCRSVDDYHTYLSFIDRRRLPSHNLHGLRDQVYYAHGVWRASGVDCRISMPQQRALEQLHGLVLYRNLIWTTQTELARELGVSESNLMKKLKVLTSVNLLRVETSRDSDIRMGEVKLMLNPRFIFRGCDSSRDACVREWYRPNGHLHDVIAHSPLAVAA